MKLTEALSRLRAAGYICIRQTGPAASFYKLGRRGMRPCLLTAAEVKTAAITLTKLNAPAT